MWITGLLERNHSQSGILAMDLGLGIALGIDGGLHCGPMMNVRDLDFWCGQAKEGRIGLTNLVWPGQGRKFLRKRVWIGGRWTLRLTSSKQVDLVAHSSRPSSAHSSRPGTPGSSQLATAAAGEGAVKPRPKVNPFGDAKPREVLLQEKGKDWRKIDLELEHRNVDRRDALGQFSMVNIELLNIVEDIKKVSKAFVVYPKNVTAENATS